MDKLNVVQKVYGLKDCEDCGKEWHAEGEAEAIGEEE